MSLKKCKECGHDVSSTAKVCPNCGARVKNEISTKAGCLVIVIFTIFIVIALVSSNHTPQSVKSTSTKGVNIDVCKKSKEIEKQLISTGFVVMSRNDCREWLVSKAWYLLPLPKKEEAIMVFSGIRNCCYGYQEIEVRDYQTGETIGEFTIWGGAKVNG